MHGVQGIIIILIVSVTDDNFNQFVNQLTRFTQFFDAASAV